MKQSFWANGRFLGEMTRPFVSLPDGFTPTHLAFCCPYCGDLWARVILDRPASWAFRSRPCRTCAADHDVWRPEHCGTLADPPEWNNSPLHFTPDWPEGAVRWEFSSLLHTFSKEPS